MSSISSWLSSPPNNFSTTLSSGVTNNALTIPLNSVTGLGTEGVGVIFKKDADGAVDATTVEFIHWTNVSGLSLTLTDTGDRGIDGSYGGAAQAHDANDYFEVWVSSQYYSSQRTGFVAEHSTAGVHDATIVAKLAGTQTFTGDKTFSGAVTFTGTVTGAGAATWTAFSGAYASGTTITVAGTDVTGIMKKGVILKWLSSADAFKTGMVVSSSFSTDTTITIVGSTVASGDKTFYYGPFADIETFIIPGTLAAGTDIAKTFYAQEEIYPLSCDAYVKTAGTTNATEFDINDDGSSIFGGTAASIASAGTSDINNAASAPTTVIAKDSLVTVDINSVSTTAPVEAYIKLFYYPKSLVSRT